MTHIELTLAVSAMTVSLATSANAYGLQPETDISIDHVSLVNALYDAQSAKSAEVYEVAISPILTQLLDLPEDA